MLSVDVNRGSSPPSVYVTSDLCASELPIPLAGQLVSPPVRTGSAGHAWVSLDDHCHLHYEIVVAGLGRADDGTVSAHLHGFAELGELRESTKREHKRLLRGFYGTEVTAFCRERQGGVLSAGSWFLIALTSSRNA